MAHGDEGPGLRVEREDELTVLTIERPWARNALDIETAAALGRAFRDFERDETAKVAVLTGTEGAFCAGADLVEMAEGADYAAWATGPDGPTGPLLSKPVIAAIAGHACADGLGLALRCDLRVVDETAVFGVFPRRWGVPMSDGTTVRLPRLIGLSRALDLMLTGRPVAAREALEIGLANRLVPAGEALAAARELALAIARFPEFAMLSDRRGTYASLDLAFEEALARESETAEAAKRLEARAGAARFTEGAGRHGRFDGD